MSKDTEITVYGEDPDISHLAPDHQTEILTQIAKRTAELRRDLERAVLRDDDES